MSLFVKQTNFSDVVLKLVDYKADYFIDSSYSTRFGILIAEVYSTKMMMDVFKTDKIVSWNTNAKLMKFNDTFVPYGETRPLSFVKYINNNNLTVIYTDGQINNNDIEQFKIKMQNKVNNNPIIIVLTIKSLDISVKTLN